MRLDGIHHVTAITGDARGNVDFYVRVLGLRMVKKTVNFDAPDVYHLYYADEHGSPGTVLTFFEFPGAARGRAGAGMIHTISWRVAGEPALDFWQARLQDEGIEADRGEGVLELADPEGLRLHLIAETETDPGLGAQAPDVPEEHALRGFHGVRAHAHRPAESSSLLEGALGFTATGGGYDVAGDRARASFTWDPAPDRPGSQGAGTVHHIAWCCADDEELRAWRARVGERGARPTPIIDRKYFHSVYFREPGGVLFELATREPGFAVDEPAEHLGESLQLPERYEAMREQLERTLTPLPNPRARAA